MESNIGLPFPSPGDLPDSGIEPWFPALQADPLPSEPPRWPYEQIRFAVLYQGEYLHLSMNQEHTLLLVLLMSSHYKIWKNLWNY